MLDVKDKKEYKQAGTTNHYSLNGATVIDSRGNEIPITPEMIERVLQTIEKQDTTH